MKLRVINELKDYSMGIAIKEDVIITTILRRGEGVESDPIRIITQVFSMDGKLIAEYDPCLYKED